MTQYRRTLTCLSIVVLVFAAFVLPSAAQGNIIPIDTLERPDKATYIEQLCANDTAIGNTFADFFTIPHQGYSWVQDVERQLGYVRRIFEINDADGGVWTDLRAGIAESAGLVTTGLNSDGTVPCEGSAGYAAARWQLISTLAATQGLLEEVGNNYDDLYGQGDAIVGRLMDKLATSHYAAFLHAYAVVNPNEFGADRVRASMTAVAAQEPSRVAEPPEPPITYDEFVNATCSDAALPAFNSGNADQPGALIDAWYTEEFLIGSGQAASRIDAAYIALYEYLRRENTTAFRDFELSMSASGVSNTLGSQLVFGAGDSPYQTRESRSDATGFAQRYLDVCDDIAAYRWGVVYDMGGYAPEPPQAWFQLLGITPARMALTDFLASGSRGDQVEGLAAIAFDALNHAEHLAMEGIEMTAASLNGENVSDFIVDYPSYVSNVVIAEQGPDAGSVFQSRPSGGLTGVMSGSSNANIRSGAGTNFDIVTAVSPGTSLTVTGRNSDSSWLSIQVNGVSGWIASFLVRVDGNVSNLAIIG